MNYLNASPRTTEEPYHEGIRNEPRLWYFKEAASEAKGGRGP